MPLGVGPALAAALAVPPLALGFGRGRLPFLSVPTRLLLLLPFAFAPRLRLGRLLLGTLLPAALVLSRAAPAATRGGVRRFGRVGGGDRDDG